MKLFRLISTVVFLLIAGVYSSALAEGGEVDAWDDANFSATMTFTTEYVSRGRSYSNEDPAIQGTFDYVNPNGVFAGIWGSSWDDGGYSSEIELGYYAGYSGTLDKLSYSLWASYYTYPGAQDDGAEWDYWELSAGLYSGYEELPLKPALSLEYYFSPEYSGEDGLFHNVAGSVDFSLPKNFTLGFLVGYNYVEGDKSTGGGAGQDGGDGYDYVNWEIGISTPLKGFALDLRYHDTNAQDFFGDAAEERLVFSVSRTM